jgi:hypothetical protein
VLEALGRRVVSVEAERTAFNTTLLDHLRETTGDSPLVPTSQAWTDSIIDLASCTGQVQAPFVFIDGEFAGGLESVGAVAAVSNSTTAQRSGSGRLRSGEGIAVQR